MGFPKIRMRRLRSSDSMRRLVRKTTLSVDDLVYPLFVREGKGLKQPIKTMRRTPSPPKLLKLPL